MNIKSQLPLMMSVPFLAATVLFTWEAKSVFAMEDGGTLWAAPFVPMAAFCAWGCIACIRLGLNPDAI